MDHYRKRGSTVRYEKGVVILVREEGEAFDDGDVFRCAPFAAEPLPALDSGAVRNVARRIEEAIPPPLSLERLIVTDGVAEHQVGDKTWSERSRRVHLSLVHGTNRLLLDEGDFDLAAAGGIFEAFARMTSERPSPPRLRLAPRVMAALTPSLIASVPPNLTIGQIAGGVDGLGNPIAESDGAEWPNWYRPSYRVRPRRVPMNVAVRCAVTTIDGGLPLAVALLAPVSDLALRVLCVDGMEAFATTARVVRIESVAPPERWYPFSAGIWSGEGEVVTGALPQAMT